MQLFFSRFLTRVKEDHLNCSLEDCNIVNHCENIFSTGNIKVSNICLQLQNVYRGYESCIKDYCKTITVDSSNLEDCKYHDSKNASEWIVRHKIIK